MASYYLLRSGGQPEGPIRKTDICRMVETGEIGADDQVSATQFGPWSRISKVPQLAALIPGNAGPGAHSPPGGMNVAQGFDSPDAGGAPQAAAGWGGQPAGAPSSAGWGGQPAPTPGAGGWGAAPAGGAAGGGWGGNAGGPGAQGWGSPAGGAPAGAGWGGPPGGAPPGAGWGGPPGGTPPGGGWGGPPGGGWGGPPGGGPTGPGWGGGGWIPPGVRNAADGAESPLLIPARIVERVMEQLNEIAKSGLLERLSAGAVGVGHAGLLAGGAAVMLFAIVFAMRLDSLKLGLLALLVPVAVAVLQFGDWKFLALCGKVVKNTPTRTSSLALYQYVALLLLLAAVGAVAGGGYMMVQLGSSEGRYIFLAAVALAVYLAIVGLLFLTPDALNLQVDGDCSAGEDGIGLIGTLLKAGLAAARLVFGAMCAFGAVAASIGAIWFTADALEPRAILWFIAGLYLLAVGAANPILLYLLSVLYYIIPDLVIGVIRHTRPKEA